MSDNDLVKLWERFRRAKYPAVRARLRNRLVELHLNLVGEILDSWLATLPAWIDQDALRQAGHLGLIRAVEKFIPGGNTKFSTFARKYVMGHAVDELRSIEPRSRRTIDDQRKREAVAAGLSNATGRRPSTDDLQGVLQWSHRRLRASEIQSALSTATVLWHDENEETTIEDVIMDGRETRTDDQFDRLDVATRGLDLQARVVLYLYFHCRLTLKDIGDLFGVTETRISQVRGRALRFLQQHRTRDELFEDLLADQRGRERERKTTGRLVATTVG